MKPLLFSLALGSTLLAGGCSTFPPYRPASEPETIELRQDSTTIYPDDFRKDPARFSHTRVAWVGIIRESHASECGGDAFCIQTTFDHHYFDWQETRHGGATYSLSPRGEGEFKTEWSVRKTDPDALPAQAELFAAPGKMAVVYGEPIGVDDKGVVILRYRYLRIIDHKKYTTYLFDYGRAGEPVKFLK